MEIVAERAISGPNIYSYHPVIKLRVELGRWRDWSTDRLPGFREKLLQALPSLMTHHCSRGVPGGFYQRLVEGTYLGHVLEHVALELQALSGAKVRYGTTRSAGRPDLYDVVYTYETAAVGLAAGRFALELLRRLLSGTYQGELAGWLEELRRLEAREGMGPSTRALIEAARARGIPVLPLEGNSYFQLGYGVKARRVEAALTSRTSVLAVDLAGDKVRAKAALAEAGLPVPQGKLVRSEEEAIAAAEALGWPVVVKPAGANQGKGVALNLENEAEVRRAFQVARHYDREILVEEAIRGKDYRLLVVDGRLVAAAERVPAHVIGDGESDVRTLVERANRDPRRGEEHEKPLTKLRLDPTSLLVLARQGLAPASIPELGRVVWLRENGNLSTGGTARDVTAGVHPSYAGLAVRAARALGLDIAGVDLVCPDIGQDWREGGGAVIEVNAAPGLRMHLYPAEGESQPVGEAIMAYLFPPEEDHSSLGAGRIPLAAVTGTNGKTTTTRLLGWVLRAQGLRVGMTTTDGIYLDEECILPGDNTGPWSARLVLRDPTVEAAVLEVARGGILRGGLGYDRSDVAIVTNLSEDHLGLEGVETLEDLAWVKSLVVECVRPGGWAILNADDAWVAGMAARLDPAAHVFYFSLDPANPRLQAHRREGGAALWVEAGRVQFAPGPLSLRGGEEKIEREISGPRVEEFPLTCQGKAQHQLQNLLAALGGALALGVPWEKAVAALRAFRSDPRHNPGRFNLLRLGDLRVVVDYGHNPAGYQATLAALAELERDLDAATAVDAAGSGVPIGVGVGTGFEAGVEARVEARTGSEVQAETGIPASAALVPGARLGVIGAPGDRPDALIEKMGELAGRAFTRLYIKEDVDRRGRAPGEVARLLQRGAERGGIAPEAVTVILPEEEAVRAVLAEAKAGDLLVIFYEKWQVVWAALTEYAARQGTTVEAVAWPALSAEQERTAGVTG